MNYDKDYADDIRAAKMLAASTPIGAAEAYVQAGIGQITAQQGPDWTHTTPADIACPASAVEQLDKRIMVEGYALQRLEEIRRDLKELGLRIPEQLVDEAIENLASQWLDDRRSYRSMT